MEEAPLKIVAVTPENVQTETLFCIRTVKNSDFEGKRKWYERRYAEGLRLHILKDSDGRMLGFIEFVPADFAWRPVDAPNFMFIHCMYVQSKKDRNQGLGSRLVAHAEAAARTERMMGLCAIASKGTWIANKSIFLRNGFTQVDQKGRFELLSKKWDKNALDPKLLDWERHQKKYMGWHLLYAEQCPWHNKSVSAIKAIAEEHAIDLCVTKLETADEAKQAPSGYGVFSLLHNGKLLEDHYLSATRFKKILKKELGNSSSG